MQAIARVNRPFPDKNYGLVVDYYGVSADLKEALAMFSTDEVRNAMVPLEDKEPELEAAHRKAVSFFDDLDDIEACVQTLEPEDTRIEFTNQFKRFSTLMDTVLPDPMANPYKGDLERLSTIYGKAKERYRDDEMNLEGCGQKVRDLIHKHIRTSGIDVLNEEPVSVMDEDEFEAKLDTLESDEARASEMQHAVRHEINVRFDEDPVHYGSLQERVEELIERYKQGRLSELEIIKELDNIMEEIRFRGKKAKEKGFTGTTELSFYHAIEDVLNERGRSVSEDDVVEWKEKVSIQEEMRQRVQIHLIKADLGLTGNERDELTNRIIKLAREHYR